MPTIPEMIAILPEFLKQKPNAFSAETLTALDQILANLDNTSEAEIYTAMVKWFQSHSDTEEKALDDFAPTDTSKQLQNKPAPLENTEAGIRQNLSEACSVRQKQKEEKQSQT